MRTNVAGEGTTQAVELPVTGGLLHGDLTVPAAATGIVLFAHGSGSSRMSPRNRQVAASLHEAGFATLLFDLLTAAEEEEDDLTAALRFDIELLADRLVVATEWVRAHPTAGQLPLGYFGASTGAAAALVAASRVAGVRAVVSRGGRPDLAGAALSFVTTPTLLIVGGRDVTVLELNREALASLGSTQKKLVLVPGATHLFEEPGAMEQVVELAAGWFAEHLAAAR
ncbi:MAG TPA: dienelactone hydrolase family protein [Gemmatimonadaceae bacterium]